MTDAASQLGQAGRYIRQPTGYRAFIPAALPPDPPLALDGEGSDCSLTQIGRWSGWTVRF